MRTRIHRLPLLLLPGYLVTSALQTSCAGEVDSANNTGAGTSPVSSLGERRCLPGEVEKPVGQSNVCCVPGSGDGTFQCHWPGASGPWAETPCTIPGATLPADEVDLSTDSCTNYTCDGDTTCQEYNAVAEEREGTLVCSRKDGNRWIWQSVSLDHRVQRICNQWGRKFCPSGALSEYDPQYWTMYPAARSSEPPYTCGYGLPVGPGDWVSVQQIQLLDSTCSSRGGDAIPCGVEKL